MKLVDPEIQPAGVACLDPEVRDIELKDIYQRRLYHV